MPNPWRKRFKPYAKSYTSFKMVERNTFIADIRTASGRSVRQILRTECTIPDGAATN